MIVGGFVSGFLVVGSFGWLITEGLPLLCSPTSTSILAGDLLLINTGATLFPITYLATF
jgi:hypothetical protein